MNTNAKTNIVPMFNLIQMKSAVRLEKVGLKHSSGRSVRKRAALLLGLPTNAKHDDVINAITTIMKKAYEMGATVSSQIKIKIEN